MMDTLTMMIFLHFLFDFYIQTKSDSLIKRKDWWEKRHNGKSKRKYNHILGLLMHSFTWSFAILIPFYLEAGTINYIALFINTIVHAIVDNLKANEKKLSSVEDQAIHFIQIGMTWFLLEMMWMK